MALIFDLNQLIDMMSIGTLLAYTIVAICVLVLRYEDDLKAESDEIVLVTASTIFRQLFNFNSYRRPNILSSSITKVSIVLFAVVCIVWCSLDKVYDFGSMPSIVSLSALTVILILIMIIIAMQPISTIELTFKVPLVPVIPCLSVFANLYLMFQLDVFTWIRFLIWIALGYMAYFMYGIWHSTQIQRNRNHIEAAMKLQHQYTNHAFESDAKTNEFNKNNVIEKI